MHVISPVWLEICINITVRHRPPVEQKHPKNTPTVKPMRAWSDMWNAYAAINAEKNEDIPSSYNCAASNENLASDMHNVHTNMSPVERTHTEQCVVGTVDRRCRAPLPKALLIGIKVFWWGRLLIRLERHASKMWRLFRPAQGLIDQGLAILSVCACVHLCVFVCLFLVITLKTRQHWLELGPSGSPWPHPNMSSVGGRTRLVLGHCHETSDKMSKWN